MVEFMRSGGFLMWPLLALGLAALVTATRRGLLGEGGDALPDRLARAALALGIGASLLGFILVFRAASAAPPEILLIGASEALSPAVLGLMIYALTTLLATLGAARLTRGAP